MSNSRNTKSVNDSVCMHQINLKSYATNCIFCLFRRRSSTYNYYYHHHIMRPLVLGCFYALHQVLVSAVSSCLTLQMYMVHCVLLLRIASFKLNAEFVSSYTGCSIKPRPLLPYTIYFKLSNNIFNTFILLAVFEN